MEDYFSKYCIKKMIMELSRDQPASYFQLFVKLGFKLYFLSEPEKEITEQQFTSVPGQVSVIGINSCQIK